MLLAFGGLMLLLGLLCGAVLTAAAVGVAGMDPGWTAWIAYPGLTLLGYGLAVVPAGDALIRVLTRAAGALCTGLGMVAIAALVLRGLGLLAVDGGTWTLWWVFACSLVLGPLGWLGAKLPRSS